MVYIYNTYFAKALFKLMQFQNKYYCNGKLQIQHLDHVFDAVSPNNP